MFEVEGRRYVLGPLDNIYVPKEVAHQATNLSANQPAMVHIAMASHSPSRTLVERTFPRREMGDDAAGTPGGASQPARTTAWYAAQPRRTGSRISLIATWAAPR